MKQKVSVLLIVLLLFSIWNPTAAILEKAEAALRPSDVGLITREVTVSSAEDTSFKVQSLPAALENYPAAYEAILQGIRNMEPSIRLASFSISPEDASEIFQYILNNDARAFHLSTALRLGVASSTGHVSFMAPQYTMEAEEYVRINALIDAEEARIIGMTDASMTPVQKALLVHDYIGANYEYDLTYEIHDVGNFILTHKGVCQSYALFFREIMNMLGIPCEFVTSYEAEHMWNIIEIDGKWYHVDVTVDDPVSDLLGRVYHEYFLLDDASLAAKATTDNDTLHPSWEADHTATDNRYASRNWTNVTAPFVSMDGIWYTLNCSQRYRPQLCTYNFATDRLMTLKTIDVPWYVWGKTTVYVATFAGLFVYRDSLILNSATDIYAYQPSSGILKKIHTPDTTAGYIYGIRRDGKNLIYATTTAPNYGHHNSAQPDTYRLYTLSLPEAEFHLENLGTQEGTLFADAMLHNFTADAWNARLIFAAYNDDGLLTDCASIPISLGAGESAAEAITFDAGNASYVRVMLWRRDAPVPLAPTVTVSLQ